MSDVRERLVENFLQWEGRGRGHLLHDAPVSPAPPFVPFAGHRLKSERPVDDGSRPTLLSRIVGRFAQSVLPPEAREPEAPAIEFSEPEPNWIGEAERHCELQLLLPENAKVESDAFARFLSGISFCRRPVAFEVVADARRVVCQFCVAVDDAPMVERQLKAHFPEASVLATELTLQRAWLGEEDAEHVELELGLAMPFMLPFADSRADLLVGLVGALSSLASGECGVYQVLFSPLAEPWAETAMRAVTGPQADLVFEGLPNIAKTTSEKVSQPLYGAVVRLAARSSDTERVWEIVREMAAPFRQFSLHGGNELMPAPNAGYPHEEHERDLLFRQSRRSGMILNLDELLGFVHLPSPAVKSAKFARISGGTRAAETAASGGGVCLGVNRHAGEESEVWFTNEQRVRHLHCIGGTGSGKSTLLFNLMLQDIENGEGLALLEPHGDLADRLMGAIPPERVDDVVVIDPSDEGFVVPFNVLSAHSDFEKTILASDLVSVFRMQSTSWGDQMQIVMQNAVLAFLESAEGGTLADMRRFLLDPAWRGRFLQTVADPDVCYYWQRGFPQLGGGKSIGPILTRLESFLSPKPIRLMVSQKENRLDFADIMDGGKIMIVRLAQGQIGRENAHLLGSLIMAKLQQTIMGRQRVAAHNRRPFFIYVDECQQFITPSMAEILSGARKYNTGLVLAHQELRQLERDKDVMSALLANACARVVFRVGDADARALAEGFAHFEAKDIQRLRIGEALCRIERADNDFNLSVPLPVELDEAAATARRAAVIESSRAVYATPRREVEADLRRRFEEAEAAISHKEASTSKRAAQRSAVDSDLAGKAGDQERDAKPAARPSETEAAAQPRVEAAASDAPVQPQPRTVGMGRGGGDHQMLVQQFYLLGTKLGYQTTKEKILPTNGRVDLALEKPERRIAVELAVNSNTGQEIHNLRKCLEADFSHVFSVSPLPCLLDGIRKTAQVEFAAADLARLHFCSCQEFEETLRDISRDDAPVPISTTPTEKVIGGRLVKIRRAETTPEGRARIEAESIALIADSLSRKREEPGG